MITIPFKGILQESIEPPHRKILTYHSMQFLWLNISCFCAQASDTMGQIAVLCQLLDLKVEFICNFDG